MGWMWPMIASIGANAASKTGAGSMQDMSKDNLLLRGLRFDKGKDWWKDSLTGFGIFGGGGEEEESAPPPEFWDNPEYTELFSNLKGVASGLLNGEVPDYYKGIGEAGGKEFEDMLGLTNRDIMESVQETSAAAGRSRGGSMPAIAAAAIGDNSTKARYADFERSLKGKQYLLGQGIDLEGDLASSALNQQAQYNNFTLGKASTVLARDKFDYNINAENDAQLGDMIGSIAGSAGGEDGWLGAFTNLFKKKATTAGAGSSPAGVSYLGSIAKDAPMTYNAFYA